MSNKQHSQRFDPKPTAFKEPTDAESLYAKPIGGDGASSLPNASAAQVNASLNPPDVGLQEAAKDKMISELQQLVADKTAANDTFKKMLRWLIGDLRRTGWLNHFLWGMADVCSPKECHQVVDFTKLQLDEYLAPFAECMRDQLQDISQARENAVPIKAESLKAMADQT